MALSQINKSYCKLHMDILHKTTIRQTLRFLNGLILSDAGFREEATSHIHTPDAGFQGEATSHTHTPEETKRRERKGHIPSVTTVSRAGSPESDGRQARRAPVPALEEKEETMEADVNQNRDTLSIADNARPDEPTRQRHGGGSPPNMVQIRSSTQEVSEPSAATTTTISGSPPNMVEIALSFPEANKTTTAPSIGAKSDNIKTTPVEAEKKKPLDKHNPQVSATVTYKNFDPNAVYCHRCHRRRYPDADGYIRHNPRLCRGRGKSY